MFKILTIKNKHLYTKIPLKFMIKYYDFYDNHVLRHLFFKENLNQMILFFFLNIYFILFFLLYKNNSFEQNFLHAIIERIIKILNNFIYNLFFKN